MITRAGIETAYCFLHQKERVYAHSTMDWQRDDIEYAISSFADDMILSCIPAGRRPHRLLRSHATFHADMLHALDILEKML